MVLFQLIIIALLTSLIFWLASHLYSTIFYVPYVNASGKAIRDALEFAGIKKGQLFLDLGCGRGDALFIANEEFGATAIGYEISPLPYLLSKIRIRLSGNNTTKTYWKDFRQAKAEIKKADLIYLYLFESVLEKNEDFIFNSLKSSGKIVTLAFKFHKHKPKKIIETINLGIKTKIYLYQK